MQSVFKRRKQNNNINIRFNNLVSFVLFVFVFLLSFSLKSETVNAGEKYSPSVIATTTNIFLGSKLDARSYVIYDIVEKRVLYEEELHTPLPLASITKLMTAYTALKIGSLNDLVEVKDFDNDGIVYGLEIGYKYKLSELLKYMLVMSSNDVAKSIAEFYGYTSFINEMNSLSLQNNWSFKFYNASGLDESDALAGGYGTAYSVAMLTGSLYNEYSSIFGETSSKFVSIDTGNGFISIPNTNQFIGEMPGILASKTGFTDLAKGNLTVIADPLLGRPIVVVVLGASKEDRFKYVSLLLTKYLESR